MPTPVKRRESSTKKAARASKMAPLPTVATAAVDASGKGPQVAINGFIAFLLFLLLTAAYMLWAILPDEVLRQLHITYYPDKYWAVAGPAMLIMFFTYYFTTYICLILVTTHPLDDGRCVTDVDSKADTQVSVGVLAANSSGVPPWVDIPVSVSSKLLYQPWKEK